MTEQSLQAWRERAAALEICADPFIDGRQVSSASPKSVPNLNPATGDVICALPEGAPQDVDRAVASARRSFESGAWRLAPPSRRKAVLLEIARRMDEEAAHLGLLDSLEMGKCIADACGEIAMASALFRFNAEALDKTNTAHAPSDHHTTAFNLLEPRGVVGAITPWNFPTANASLKVAPALAAGNSIVLKPSEISTLSALRLAALAVEAGLPEGVFNVTPGLGATAGAALASHADVDFLSFTGSSATGRKLMGYAAESNGKPMILECGGKSPQVIAEDMAGDLDAILDAVIGEALWNQGQVCVARTRVLAARPLYARLTEAIAARVGAMKPADPLDPQAAFGALASQAQFDKVFTYAALGAAEGARLVTPKADQRGPGLYLAPMVFDSVEPSMRIAREEIFGPIITVIPFDSFDQAIAIANDTEYGLAATLWSRDFPTINRFVRETRSGKLVVRSSAAASERLGFSQAAEPFGQSGFGVEGGMDWIRTYSRLKAVEMIA